MPLTVLVTGASGFIGSHVARALSEAGHEVRAMTRRPDDYTGAGKPVAGDVFADEGLRAALDGVDAAYYLVHSLDSDDFEERDARAARAFGRAAADAGVRQIVYLGGLGAEDGDLSPHLRSRRATESHLAEAGVPVTTLRAGIVVGHGGASWEITRQVVNAMPLMVAPGWVRTRTQPIGLPDIVHYLVGVLDHPDALGRTFEVGGPEALTYEEMLQAAAVALRGESVPLVAVDVPRIPGVDGLATDFMGLALSFITDVDPATARNLLGSMGTEAVVTSDDIHTVLPRKTIGYDDMVRAALEDRLAAGLEP